MQDIEKAEKVILGTVLSMQEYQDVILSDLKPYYFYNDNNNMLCNKLLEMHQKGLKIDILTVVNNFSKPELEKIGGAYYISNLTAHVASGYNYDAHLKIIKEAYIRRSMVELFTKEMQKLSDRSIDIHDSYLTATKKLEELFTIPSNDFKQVSEIIEKRLQDYEDAFNRGNQIIGLNTGHSKLNKITNGWQAGDMIILAARPSMGKTAISLYFAKCPAKEGKTVLYFSLEMPAERLIDRIISTDTNIDSIKLQSGQIEDYEWEQLTIKTCDYKNNTLIIDDDSALTIEDIKHKAQTFISRSGKIDLIIIDYLQLINFSGGGGSTNDKVGHISKQIKTMAKKLKCPVMALSQLNRSVEQRSGDKRPQMSDLRDSGNIEQDADVIIFLYRPEYYGFTEDQEGNSVRNVIEAIVQKNRNGSLGSTEFNKNDNWSYIGEMPIEEMNSLEMPFSMESGIEPNYGGF